MHIAIDSIREGVENQNRVTDNSPIFCVSDTAECSAGIGRESASGIGAATLPSSFRGRSRAFDNGATRRTPAR